MTTGWQHAARLRLTGRGDVHLRLGELIPASELPPWPCYLPWIRLEISTARLVGPCCSDYQVAPFRRDGSIELGEMWNAPELRAFRRNMSSGRHLTSCRTTCPVLAGATARVPDLVLRGGTAAFVEHEIAATQAMLDGELELRTQPLDVTFPPTTFCNYDCLMCEWGEMGTLADELDESFYASLSTMLPTLRTIGVSGGEPLASPRFRRFLAELDWAACPDLRVSLITNGSYLTLEEQERLARVPFTGITLSLNAASPETYELVNRGLPWSRLRGNLDGLLQRRHDGRLRGTITYSMVLLRSNLHEIEAFADLARRDGVSVRYMLPMFDRHGQSIMTDQESMLFAQAALERVSAGERRRGHPERAASILGEAEVLRSRLQAGLRAPLPDGRASPRDPGPRPG